MISAAICAARYLVTVRLVIQQRTRQLGSLDARRALLLAKRRTVGRYFCFYRMGPRDVLPGLPCEVDVRRHPHIGLSTLTTFSTVRSRNTAAWDQSGRWVPARST